MDEKETCQARRSRAARPEEALFVHVKWETRNGEPLLCDEDIRQAAYAAAKCCARTHRCHTLALGGQADHIHAIFEFPASLSISTLAKLTMQASGEAVARFLTFMRERPVATDAVWEPGYSRRTLNESDLPQVIASIEQQAARHAQGQTCEELEQDVVPHAPRLSPHESNLIREKSGIPYFPN